METAKVLNLEIKELIESVMCNSVKQTLETVFGVKVTLKQILYPDFDFSKREISGVIAFVQDQIEGTLALSYSRETAYKLMSKFYGTEFTHVSDEIIDGVSEITNMVHGMTKEELNKMGFNFTMCLPIVVVGQQHYVFSTVAGTRILAEFHTLYGPVFGEVVIYDEKSRP